MKYAQWFILFVMFFHISCGGNTTLNNEQVSVTENSISDESTDSERVQQAEESTPVTTAKRLSSDTIFLEDGTINGYEIKITKSGSESNPVVLTARHPGKTIITGEISIEIAGSYIQVRDLIFKNIKSVGKGYDPIKFTGEHCSMLNCLVYNTEDFKGGKTYYWVVVDGYKNEVRGNTFVGKENKAPLIWVIADNPNKGNHVISQNLFARIKPLGKNGLSAIRIGLKTDEPIFSGTLVERNIFHECDGELEIISSKSSKNLIVDNMFSESRGGLTLRWGDDCKVSNNLFVSSKNTSIGVRVAGSKHRIVYNTFNLVGGPNAAAIVLMVGSTNPKCGYQPTKDIDIHDNQFYGNAAWKVLENVNCDEPPQFTAKDNFKFGKGQAKGKKCDYSVDNKTKSVARKGNSKILKEIYEIAALDGEGERNGVTRIDAPDLSSFINMRSNKSFLEKWAQTNPKLINEGVGSTLSVP